MDSFGRSGYTDFAANARNLTNLRAKILNTALPGSRRLINTDNDFSNFQRKISLARPTPTENTLHLQRPLPNGSLQIVATGQKTGGNEG